MALGGGTFLVQNKILPGAYMNFISVAYASATLSDRGIATIALDMNWGPESKVFTVELTGGENGATEDVAHQNYLDAMESYTYNAMGCMSTDPVIKGLYAAYNRRMRDDVGKKCQVVVSNSLADYEGVVSVKNGLEGVDEETAALIPWTVGVVAGTAVNKSATNMDYDGEYSIDTSYTQTQLENGLKEGSWMFHTVDEKVVVLEDINTFVSITDEKSPDFSSNQTIRVLDQIANDIAVLFGKKYIGRVPNDEPGRLSLWRDITKHHEQLQKIRAIENFDPENVTVEKGDTKKAVVVTDYVSPVNAMAQLYMTVAGTATDIDFTKVAASDVEYQVEELEGLDSLDGIMQEAEVSRKSLTNEVAVKVETAFTNTKLTVGYHMRVLGLYAVDPDAGEILYAACVELSGNCYMPPYNGITVSGAYIQLITTVGNANNVSLEVNPSAIATIGDIQYLQNQINEIQVFIGTDGNGAKNHISASIAGATGVHGLRFNNNELQIKDGDQWRSASDKAGVMSAHDADTNAHPFILKQISDLDGRLGLLELKYGTSVSGNSFNVTFADLAGLVVANDSKEDSEAYAVTFTKAVYSAGVTLETPMEADDQIRVMVMALVGSVPAGAELEVLVTNNAKDDEPVWEDATGDVKNGTNHVFANQTAANGFAFNFKLTVSRGENGQGGYLTSIGGAFE